MVSGGPPGVSVVDPATRLVGLPVNKTPPIVYVDSAGAAVVAGSVFEPAPLVTEASEGVAGSPVTELPVSEPLAPVEEAPGTELSVAEGRGSVDDPPVADASEVVAGPPVTEAPVVEPPVEETSGGELPVAEASGKELPDTELPVAGGKVPVTEPPLPAADVPGLATAVPDVDCCPAVEQSVVGMTVGPEAGGAVYGQGLSPLVMP